ncbi:type I-C CRISPR-associated protein Cas8c/Csd1 [Alteromonas sp. a30]|uniref:type I-C CRISPR-associated protein Cas8c/Csd1 n=1 Tax=Alteromonas sp. a30 TaxID=2730917 RepID=UPI00227E3B0B|nr:type I-C CRISPR-associated protein Cas8c/Csd1 [Alteromonas sp. a30]MCY7295736.1 type I-C CRISPR-associated protein Cas8c/Csd1 [Alteromonas sp. a30]
MSWMQRLYDTYERGMTLDLDEDQKPMPISHTLQNAHIEIVIDKLGNFVRANPKEKFQVVLPATEKSAGRSSGEAPHPLADKLQYVAGDYASFGGQKKHYFASYQEQLKTWCDSEFAHPKIQAVLNYISKGSVISDLIKAKVCYVDDENTLLTTWPYEVTEENPVPTLFKALPKEAGKLDQGNALVCWTVENDGDLPSETWLHPDVQQRWIDFDAINAGKQSMCFITGEIKPIASNHPAKLRHTGDKAKLISANDSSGFTYRGRFESDSQASNVSVEVTQKAHNALRWLIDRQPKGRNGDQAIVVWAISGKDSLPAMTSTVDLDDWDDFDSDNADQSANHEDATVDLTIDLGQQFAAQLQRYMKGYWQGKNALEPDETVCIMALDSATPGRMGIVYYRDFRAKEYVQMIERWHSEFAWPQRITKEEEQEGKKPKSVTRWIPSAPSPWSILQTTYGNIVKSNETLKKNLNERIMPCIIEGRPFPEDLVNLAVNRASNPNSGEYWEWERNLGVACALYRGFHHPNRQPKKSKQKECTMSLNKDNRSRDYLYGRLLAVAEKIEETALYVAGVKRTTTAARLMQRFSQRPFSTWNTLYRQIQPYIQQLTVSREGFIHNRKMDLDEITSAFEDTDFTNDSPLTGEYLLGFHCQRMALRSSKKDTPDTNAETETTTAAE